MPEFYARNSTGAFPYINFSFKEDNIIFHYKET